MGSSKKSKKEHKEHKHKKRDRSPSPTDRDRQRSRSREKDKHKDKKRRGEDDVEEQTAVRIKEEPQDKSASKSQATEAGNDNGASAGGGGDLSLSIEETNRLRAKLGLKPLETNAASKPGTKEDGKPASKSEDVHKPAINLREKQRTDSLKEKLDQQKEKRQISTKLAKVRTLGDEDEDDGGALEWVKRSRKMEEEKIQAERRAKMLEELDSDFGISGLVEAEFGAKKGPEYTSKNLKGLRVEHAMDSFTEEKAVILTLKDRGVLEEEDDTLVNVNIVDSEKAKENMENKKKKPDYKPYDEPEYDEYGVFKPRDILEKYNDEIDGKKIQSFVLGSGGRYKPDDERETARIRAELQQQRQTLELPEMQLARDFYTDAEMAKFKKPVKKVRKIRKKVRADDLLPLEDDNPSEPSVRRRRLDDDDSAMDTGPVIPGLLLGKGATKDKRSAIPGLDLVQADQVDALLESSYMPDMLGPQEDLTGFSIEDEAGTELELALEKTRRLKQGKERVDVAQRLGATVKTEPMDEDGDDEAGDFGWRQGDEPENLTVMLNTTSEFCRSLGESLAARRTAAAAEEDDDELLDFERDLVEQRRNGEEPSTEVSGWQKVDASDDRPADLTSVEQEVNTGLEEEPLLNVGIAAALGLAQKKGYFEKEKTKVVAGSRTTLLPDANYTIEDKKFDDIDDKHTRKGRGERISYGAVSDFKEKDGYKPDVKITYTDDKGRMLDQKEAFRYLSHRFHGKGSGKKKTEKRIQKFQEEMMLRAMSSSDTPLGTAALLEDKLKKEQQPFIVLSGTSKAGSSGASLVK